MTFSVIIPLYNKEREVARAVRSVLAQTAPPLEIIVVDDGSTDGGAAIVEEVNSQIIRLIRQENAGETAARNRGMSEARGEYFALLDADDEWHPGFLEAISLLISDFPAAGIYCTGFDVARGKILTPGKTPSERGIVPDFFDVAMTRFVATASSAVLPRVIIDHLGGFPEGMRLGGDQWMWTKIALAHPVAFTPERLAVVHAGASNRSAAIYMPERTEHSFMDFFDPNRLSVNEFIARVALGKAIVVTCKGGTAEGLAAEQNFAYNRLSRRLWRRLWLLNRLPKSWRPRLNGIYNRLAWLLVRRGY